MAYRRSYVYSLGAITIPANGRSQEPAVEIHRPWVLRRISNGVTPGGRYGINVVSQKTKFRFFAEEIRDDLIVGNGQDANVLWSGFVFPAGDFLIASLNDLSGASNATRIDFHGYELEGPPDAIDYPEPGWAHKSYQFAPAAIAASTRVHGLSVLLQEDFVLRALTITSTGLFDLNIYAKQAGRRVFGTDMRSLSFNGNTTDMFYLPDVYIKSGDSAGEDLVFDVEDVSGSSDTILVALHGIAPVQGRMI